jgi:hypothetical protein
MRLSCMSPFRIAALAMLAVGHAGDADAQPRFDATLLSPVDSQITFYTAQLGYFALIGIARDSAVHLIWHDVVSPGIGGEYVFVPKRDSDYVRIYFLGSSALLDLKALEHTPSAYALGEAIASAEVVEGYDRRPERQFFALADPGQRDSLTLSRVRVSRTADAREALHPRPGLNGLSLETYWHCVYAMSRGRRNEPWCDALR